MGSFICEVKMRDYMASFFSFFKSEPVGPRSLYKFSHNKTQIILIGERHNDQLSQN